MKKKQFSFPQELWDAYWASRSDESRNVLAEYYWGIPRICAVKIHDKFRQHVSRDDLVQAGSIGLMQAIASFDRSHGVEFVTHAGIRVHGAMIDYIRDCSLATRTTMKLIKKITNAEVKLLQEHSRPPSIAEIENEIGKSLDSPHGRFALKPTIRSLSSKKYANHEGTPMTLAESIADPHEGPAEILENKMFVEGAMGTIERWVIENYPLRLALIFKMRFRLGLIYTEIGKALGVSESMSCTYGQSIVKRIRYAISTGNLEIQDMPVSKRKIDGRSLRERSGRKAG